MTVPAFATSGWRDGWYFVPHEVTWRDLDAVGHVNNAVYFTFFEWARTKYWFDLTGGSAPADLGFIVARAQCDFRIQLGLTEKIEIGVRIAGMRNSSFDFVYEIRNATGRVAAVGTVVVVLYSWERNEKIRIGEALRSRIDAFQGEGAGI
ncbi:MAG: acyl-CoA thioesterase [Acidobacteriota bacterium]